MRPERGGSLADLAEGGRRIPTTRSLPETVRWLIPLASIRPLLRSGTESCRPPPVTKRGRRCSTPSTRYPARANHASQFCQDIWFAGMMACDHAWPRRCRCRGRHLTRVELADVAHLDWSKMARVHIKPITAEFVPLPLIAGRPSMVKAWTAKTKAEVRATFYIYVDTTEQMWALQARWRAPAASCGPAGRLRGSADLGDVRTSGERRRLHTGHRLAGDQWPADPLKSDCSRTPSPADPYLRRSAGCEPQMS